MFDNQPDTKDSVSLDVPLFIRMLELAREDIKSDEELHKVVERVLDLKDKGTLTMDDYSYIVNSESKDQEPVPTSSHDELSSIKKLAGI